ncbi:hypothetical protein M3I53_34550 [Paraburkholderia sp. CNPSo 3272]|uniref:hypothetical protein n=1 Tax=Paraburkholderia sp. CNPSo 3272 TaxID=2940931 RepID=UPI0020B84839|nr:hypothetical protein [Paraburkholderia sp. CNPSo 3272]MCP3728171.1 hypothetical protein [Paraburkholderia sp. CNPSo 3272]
MMFVFLFPVFLPRVLRAVCRRARMRVAAAVLACLHGFAFAAAVRATPAGVRRRSLHLARRAAHMAARGALRTVHAGHPLTPTGYVLLGATLAAATLVSLLCACACACEPERPLWPRSRFA